MKCIRDNGNRTRRRIRIDGIRILGILFAIYLGISMSTILPSAALPVSTTSYLSVTMASLVVLLATSLVLSLRTVALLVWLGLCLVASWIYSIPSITLEHLSELLRLLIGVGLPSLFLLETILTMEGANARARVVFRPKPLAKTAILMAFVVVGFVVSFTYVPILSNYGASPEAASFQSPMIAGLSTILLGPIILARVRTRAVTT